jgi:peptidoglycan/LPS O-acetylase OafA/YrhL
MNASQDVLSHPPYRSDIDGLRAVAVLSVVFFHASPDVIRGGFVGVDVFFVISGYLISTNIFQSLDGGSFNYLAFYIRRIKRIFPALLVVLVACMTFGWFALLAEEYKQLGKHVAASAVFISNFILWHEVGYFDNAAETKPLLHLWSLGVEEQFYIIWPVLLAMAWKFRLNLLTMAVVLTIASLFLNLGEVKKDAVATFYSPQTRFWELLCGSALAWIVLYKNDAFSRFELKLDTLLASVFYRSPVVCDGSALGNARSALGTVLLIYGFFA